MNEWDNLLLSSAGLGCEEKVIQALNHGAISQNEALFCAVRNGNQRIVQLLVDHGADLNAINKQSQSVLVLAAALGKGKLARFLLKMYGERVDLNKLDCEGRTAIYYSFVHRDWRLIQALISYGANPNVKVPMSFQGETEIGLIFACFLFQRWDLALDVLRHGADLYQTTPKGNKICDFLIWNRTERFWDFISVLHENGYDDREGDFFFAAAFQGRMDWVDQQIEWGWKPDKRILFAAAAGGQLAILKEFVESRGWSVLDAGTDSVGDTLLHVAVRSRCAKPEVVAWLLEQGVDYSVRNKQEQTAERLAFDCGNSRCAVLLSNIRERSETFYPESINHVQ